MGDPELRVENSILGQLLGLVLQHVRRLRHHDMDGNLLVERVDTACLN